MSKKYIDYHKTLIERLKDREYAVTYLNAAIDEAIKNDLESQQLFLKALRNVAEAQGSISESNTKRSQNTPLA